MYLLVPIIGYIFGCINGSQIIGKYKNINIKQSGMKNAGASNTTILLGWKYGAVVAFIDVFKAVISLMITALILNNINILFNWKMFILILISLFLVISHNFQ